MSFKRVMVATALWGVLFSGGCSKKELPTGAGGGLGLGGASSGRACLDRAGETAKRYLDGRAEASETAELWNCAIESLQLFTERTRGESQGFYTPAELRAFIQTYFLKEYRVSDVLLRELMEIKRAMIGGSLDALTLGEIEKFKRLLGLFREQSLLLRQYMPLTGTHAAQISPAEAEATARALARAARALGAELEGTAIPYSFAHLSELLQQLDVSEGVPDLDVLRAVKGLLIAPVGDRIAGNEWSTALEVSARWYGLWLRYRSIEAARTSSWIEGQSREQALLLGREAVKLLDEAIARHPRQLVTFDELDRLVDALAPQGFTAERNSKVPAAHIKSFLRPWIRRVMGGDDSGFTGRAALGLTRPALARTWRRVEHWSEGQRYLEGLFAGAMKTSRNGAIAAAGFRANELFPFSLRRLFSMGVLAPTPGTGLATLDLTDAAARLQKIIELDRPVLEDDYRMKFEGYKVARRHTLHGLTAANWMYALSRAMIAGYAEASHRAVADHDSDAAVNLVEFKRFCQDIFDVAVDLKYLDPNDPKVAEMRFREGDLFTFAGNGDGWFSVREGAQLVGMMLSAKILSNQIHEEVVEAGCQVGPMDPFGYLTIDSPCYRSVFFGNSDRYWSRMPGLAGFYRRMRHEDREAFERAIEESARKKGYAPTMMDSSASEGFAMVGHYIETVFAKYDRDESGALDGEEAKTAFPVFKKTLMEISCQVGQCLKDEADLMAVFTYMLAYGEIPSAFQFARWRYLPFFRGFQADRARLADIFAMLGKAASSSP